MDYSGKAVAFTSCPIQELSLVSASATGPHTGAVFGDVPDNEGWADHGYMMVHDSHGIVLYDMNRLATLKAHRVEQGWPQ